MDAVLRDLERRAILGDLLARTALRDHWVRLRDPRLHPLVGDVLCGLPRASGRALDPARRADQLDRMAVRFRGAGECLPVPHRLGWSWARVVTGITLVQGEGIVTWDPVYSWNNQLPFRAPARGTRQASLRTFRRWARSCVVLQVVEEEPVVAAVERRQRSTKLTADAKENA